MTFGFEDCWRFVFCGVPTSMRIGLGQRNAPICSSSANFIFTCPAWLKHSKPVNSTIQTSIRFWFKSSTLAETSTIQYYPVLSSTIQYYPVLSSTSIYSFWDFPWRKITSTGADNAPWCSIVAIRWGAWLHRLYRCPVDRRHLDHTPELRQHRIGGVHVAGAAGGEIGGTASQGATKVLKHVEHLRETWGKENNWRKMLD